MSGKEFGGENSERQAEKGKKLVRMREVDEQAENGNRVGGGY